MSYCSDGTFDGINEIAPIVPEAEGDVAHGCNEDGAVAVEVALDFIADGTGYCLPV